jgi:hypothetical protein
VRAVVLLFLLISFGAGACGGDDEGGEESEPARPKVECEGASVEANLPADFPELAGVTYTKSTSAGQSTIVDGYYRGSLEDAYESFKTAIRDAGYFVIFDEIEAADSEVAYSGGDENTSGIVALRENCAQSDRISIHVTNRPD